MRKQKTASDILNVQNKQKTTTADSSEEQAKQKE